MRPIAYRRGWVAEAPAGVVEATAAAAAERGWSSSADVSEGEVQEVVAVDFPATLAFVRQADGAWALALPAPPGLASAAEVALDVGEAALRATFPGQEPLDVPWPAGVEPAQIERCTARFLRRRCELLVTLPAAQTTVATSAVVGAGLSEVAAPEEVVAAPAAAAALATSAAMPEVAASEVVAPQVPAAPATGTATPPAVVTEPPPSPLPPSSAGSAPGGGSSGVPSPAEVERKVNVFKQRLKEKPGAGLSFDPATGQSMPVDVDPQAMDIAGILMLHSAAATGNVELANRLMGAGISPDAEDDSGCTVLEKACIAESVAVAEALLAKGASARGSPGAPSTPLHRAACLGGATGVRLVRLLLAKGADRAGKDSQGRTAAEAARSAGASLPPELLMAPAGAGW